MRTKVATKAEAIKRSWAEDVGPKCNFMGQQMRKRQSHSGPMLCRRSAVYNGSIEGCNPINIYKYILIYIYIKKCINIYGALEIPQPQVCRGNLQAY
jgi:hypothetical protein